jgi:hypothetical protein
MPNDLSDVEHLSLPDETSAAENTLPCSTQYELKIWFTKPNSDDKKQLAQSLQPGAAEASSEDTPSNSKKSPNK